MAGHPGKIMSRANATKIYALLCGPNPPSLDVFVDGVAPDTTQYEGKVLVRLYTTFYRGGSFSNEMLWDRDRYERWDRRNPWVSLGEVNGKHSRVVERLNDLVDEVITDPFAIYSLARFKQDPKKSFPWSLYEENFYREYTDGRLSRRWIGETGTSSDEESDVGDEEGEEEKGSTNDAAPVAPGDASDGGKDAAPDGGGVADPLASSNVADVSTSSPAKRPRPDDV